MRRIEIELPEEVAEFLEFRAKADGVAPATLAATLLMQRFDEYLAERKAAMEAIVGIWSDLEMDGSEYVRRLRRGEPLPDRKAS